MTMINTRTLLVVALGFALPLMMCAQPRLQMQSLVDWGVVVPRGSLTKQESVKYRVPIKNTGSKVLAISSVRPQCGCTVAALERDTLKPGEETAMNITLTLPAGSGVVDKYVTVFSNDSAGSHVVKLRAEVQRPLQLSSSFLGFNQVYVGEPTRAKIKLTTQVDEDVTITIEPGTPGLSVIGPSTRTAIKGVAVPIEVEYVPKAFGAFNVALKIKTSLKDYEEIDITGYGIADAPKR